MSPNLQKNSFETRDHNLDLLRVLAMVAVVVIHAAAPFIARSNGHNSQFVIAVLFDSFSRFCVPLFVMISGALMFSINENIDKKPLQFYWKKFIRFVPALLFWVVFYWIFTGRIHDVLSGGTVLMTIVNGWRILLSDVPHYHLWYIYMLPGLFLVGPLLKKVKRILTPKQWLSLGIILLLFGILDNGWRIYTSYSLPRYYEFIDFLGYLILGDYLLTLKFSKQKALIGYATGSLVLAAVIYFYTLQHPGQFFFDSFLSPFIVLPTISLYVLINQGFDFAKKKFIYDVALVSFGIYLVHAAVIDKLMWMSDFAVTPYPLIDIILYTTATLGISYGIVKILRSIKLFSWLT